MLLHARSSHRLDLDSHQAQHNYGVDYPVGDAAVKEFVRGQAVGKLVPQIESPWVLQQHPEVETNVLRQLRPHEIVAKHISQWDYLKATVMAVWSRDNTPKRAQQVT
jgi:hypothetical protein